MQQEHAPPHIHENPYKVAFIILVSVLVLFGVFVVVGNTAQVRYTVPEIYYEKQPYDAIEWYTVSVPYESIEKNPNCTFGILCDYWITVTRFKEESRQRTVTKYQDVPQTKYIIKYHPVFAEWNYPDWLRWDI